jgi:hypothetical protein
MVKIFIKFNAAVIKEVTMDKPTIKFGRKEGNDIQIDNQAVSGHHGKIIKEGNRYYVVDLGSTNGTYLNGRPVKRSLIKNKDQIRVARHILEIFSDEDVAEPEPEPTPPKKLDTKEATDPDQPLTREEQISILKEKLELPEQEEAILAKAPPPPPLPQAAVPPKAEEKKPLDQHGIIDQKNQGEPSKPVATIKIISGQVGDRSEIEIKDNVTYIGTSDKALLKIRGFLAPDLAAAISKHHEGYFLRAIKPGYPKVNGQTIREQVFLKSGALIEAGGTNFVFYYNDPNMGKNDEKTPPPASDQQKAS